MYIYYESGILKINELYQHGTEKLIL